MGDGGASARRVRIERYKRPAGGWGSLEGMVKVARHARPPLLETLRQLLRQNKHEGFACTSCAWSRPEKPGAVEFCENGAKATIWDLTRRRCTPEFFARHTVTELLDWSDFNLEQAGRLTAPMRYDAASDRYVECGWDEA